MLIIPDGEGGQNLREAAISGAVPDPPCIRHVRDTYETGTSHVRASGTDGLAV